MSIKVQEAPQAPSYAAANIQVPANIATPQSTMEGVKAQQGQLNAVNNLSGGRHRTSTTKRQKRQRSYKHKSVIRTYKGRRYQQQQQQPQQGGAGERIPVPQVGTTCSSGPQCMGSQNANLTALNNQATSNSINDAYAQSGGSRHKKVRFSHTKRHRNTKQRHDHSFTSTIAYNIKKVLRKVFA
jgi:hypothetical protein